MAEEISSKKTTFDRDDRRAVKRRFQVLNRERVRRVEVSLRDRQQDFLELLPLLFHINHPTLPGYLSAKTPCGISDYTPTNRSIEAGKRLSKSFAYKRQIQRQYDVYALYLIGSSGTVAHSDRSDFDVWVCHRPELNEDDLEALRRKAEGIQHWAASIGLETHFYVMNDAGFRRGEYLALSAESSGSSQRHLLVEEFYRTGLLIAGRYPIWWLVPPEMEADYDNYVHDLLSKRFIGPNECLDFGGVGMLDAGEFFGAALWQLYKALDSPYKSVLKILLMEAYASEYPNVESLCLRFKKAVYDGETNLDQLDPYVSMCRKVEDYLRERDDMERLELARRCLYFKVGELMSRQDTLRNSTWRREAMRDLVNEWGWDRPTLFMLDSRSTWKIDRVLEERRTLVDALTRSYQHLSAFVRHQSDGVSIDPRDLNRLGRKLYAAFERKAGKVEIINPGISTDLVEERLSLHRVRNQDQRGWLLYRDLVKEDETQRHTPIKRAHSLLEILAWCHFNGVLHPSMTMLNVFPIEEAPDPWELRSLLECLRQTFPGNGIPEGAMADLERPARIRDSMIFINLGTDPQDKYTRQGKQLITSRTDALRYGATWENLALTFDQLLVTSWQEVLTQKYQGETALLDCLCDYLAWTPVSGTDAPPLPACFSFSSTRGAAIARRIEEVFGHIIQCFYQTAGKRNLRYVLHGGSSYFVLQPENDVPRYKRLPSYGALLQHLGMPQEQFSAINVDPQTLVDSPLPAVCEHNRPGVVQLFYRATGNQAEVFVMDEKGSLFHQTTNFQDATTLLSQYQRFLEAVQHRRDLRGQSAPNPDGRDPVEYYQLQNSGVGKYRVARQTPRFNARARDYFGIQVIGDTLDDSGTVFTMYCGEREFSTLEHGDGLFDAVARHVLEQRAGGARYPIYITDIDLSRSLLGADALSGIQTAHLLAYKKRIEDRLNETLQHI